MKVDEAMEVSLPRHMMVPGLRGRLEDTLGGTTHVDRAAAKEEILATVKEAGMVASTQQES